MNFCSVVTTIKEIKAATNTVRNIDVVLKTWMVGNNLMKVVFKNPYKQVSPPSRINGYHVLDRFVKSYLLLLISDSSASILEIVFSPPHTP